MCPPRLRWNMPSGCSLLMIIICPPRYDPENVDLLSDVVKDDLMGLHDVFGAEVAGFLAVALDYYLHKLFVFLAIVGRPAAIGEVTRGESLLLGRAHHGLEPEPDRAPRHLPGGGSAHHRGHDRHR